MTHPPIPSNSPFFITCSVEKAKWYGRKWFTIGGDDTLTFLDEDESYVSPLRRKLIAAVAEVAWREEADAETKLLVANQGHAAARLVQILDIANAWRAWGKGERKP